MKNIIVFFFTIQLKNRCKKYFYVSWFLILFLNFVEIHITFTSQKSRLQKRHVKITKNTVWNFNLLLIKVRRLSVTYFSAKITKNAKMSEGMSAFAAYKSVEKKRIVEEPKKKKNRNRKNRNKVNM